MEDRGRDGKGWEQLLAKIPWRCGRYSLVERRRRKTEEKRRPHPLPKSEVALEKDAHFAGAAFAI